MNAHLLQLSHDTWADLQRQIGELCVRTPVILGIGALAKDASQLQPGLNFHEALVRGGWYRLGGVVNGAGERVADDIENWAETQLAAHDDDLGMFFDTHVESGLQATRLIGKTHYLVAPLGEGAGDFLQVEVEELQEVISHPLFREDLPPASLEDLLDPRDAAPNAMRPVSVPFYALRRITDVGEFLARMWERKAEAQPVHRFLDAWEMSSAGVAAEFSNHWVLAVREHLDRYRQPIFHASPIAALNGMPPRLTLGFGDQGLALHGALQRFDRQVGYPMAWFFHMLTTKVVPHAVASAVINDLQSGFNYLPDRDAQVVKEWLYRPFGF